VFHRPLALVGALTAGDFVLWNWSLSASHDVLALIAGVTLLPLAAASALLLALTALQVASRFSRLSSVSAAFHRASAIQRRHLTSAQPPAPERALAFELADHDLVATPAPAAAARPSRKLAA
jgi:hypothetical protein